MRHGSWPLCPMVDALRQRIEGDVGDEDHAARLGGEVENAASKGGVACRGDNFAIYREVERAAVDDEIVGMWLIQRRWQFTIFKRLFVAVYRIVGVEFPLAVGVHQEAIAAEGDRFRRRCLLAELEAEIIGAADANGLYLRLNNVVLGESAVGQAFQLGQRQRAGAIRPGEHRAAAQTMLLLALDIRKPLGALRIALAGGTGRIEYLARGHQWPEGVRLWRRRRQRSGCRSRRRDEAREGWQKARGREYPADHDHYQRQHE